jgi:hypothetical protein
MGKFDEALYREIADYLADNYPGIATLLRKEFNAASSDFSDGSIDLLHIDGTHTFEAVGNDFYTWLPKMSERGVILFHDVNVNVENTGPSSAKFGVKKFFDSVSDRYPHFEFQHCWGLGVLVVGKDAPKEVLELVEMSRSPEFTAFFAAKGGLVSKSFEESGVGVQMHPPYDETSPAPVPAPRPPWRRALGKIKRMLVGASR